MTTAIKIGGVLLAIGGVLLAAVILSGRTAVETPVAVSVQDSSIGSSAGGMRVQIDPLTGAVVQPPPGGGPALQLTPQEQNALSTSQQGLVEVPSSVPGGGVKVDLQGRFQSPLIATIGSDGKVKIDHGGHQSDDHK